MRTFDLAAAAFFAEVRSSFRRVRTYVFVAVTAGGIVGTLVLASEASSQVAPLAGAYAPRFALSATGSVWLWLFVIATVFLAFDARQQDERARVAEVLHARPISNLALLVGRWAATVLVAWLALVAIAMLIQAGGAASRMIHEASGSETATLAWWLGVTVEPVSLATLLTVDAVPALALAAALVVFLAAALRGRTWTIVVALALVGLHVYAVAKTPMVLLPTVSLVTSYANFASDLAPAFAGPAVLVQRAALLFFAAALLIGAAALDRRDDGGSRLRRGVVAVVLAAVGGVGIGVVAAGGVGDLGVRERWLAAHEAARDLAFPDVRHVAGELRIDPGRELAMDLALTVAAPPDASLARLRFSLNPGLAASAAAVDGKAVATTHVDGILTVELEEPLAPTREAALSLRASGVPDERFAYLDSSVDWHRLPASNRLHLLGTDALVFSGSYVGLMPGTAWLPTAGPNLADRPSDVFTTDLVVHVPEDWQVAGPGRRETVAPGVFRFKPVAPVPAIGLFASRFERRAVEVAGVVLEIFVAPEHAGHLDGLREVMEDENGILGRVEEMLDRARERGLPYPFAGFSMVEVPARLRAYGGGRALDTTLFPPGLALVPEYGFPTRFERVYMDRRINFRLGYKLATETADRKLGMLWRVFGSEGGAGELPHAALNAFALRARPENAAPALDALSRVLSARIVWQLPGGESFAPFTAHRFAGESHEQANPLLALVWGGGPANRQPRASGPAVWEAAETTALDDLADLPDAALALDVLALRIDHTARAIQDRYGLEKAAAMLVELRRRFGDTGFSASDLEAASVDVDMDLKALLGDWLRATAMPGYRVSTVEAFRIPDGDDGQPRYQVLVDVRNGEPMPGLIRITYATSPGSGPWVNSDPIPVAGDSAVQIGEVLARPPEELWIRTYLSRNRAEMSVPVGSVDADRVMDRVALTGIRPSDWRARDHGIIVDDLDDGFAVASTASAVRLGGGMADAEKVETDAGLPVHGRSGPRGWKRQSLPTAWGRYRRTLARIGAGPGASRATFDAELPASGAWRLSYHVPDLEKVGMRSQMWSSLDEQGTHSLEIASGDDVTTVDFDAAAAPPGWNEIDVFELDAGSVRVAVSDKTSGRTVVADAIRWERRDP